MSGTQNNYYIEPNPNLQGYDILKRDSVVNQNGTLSPERVCTIYSMEYLNTVLKALGEVDNSNYQQPNVPSSSRIYEK